MLFSSYALGAPSRVAEGTSGALQEAVMRLCPLMLPKKLLRFRNAL